MRAFVVRLWKWLGDVSSPLQAITALFAIGGVLVGVLFLVLNSLSSNPRSTDDAGHSVQTDCAKFLEDENYPDGSVVPRGQTITKSWIVENCGDTVWRGYRAVRTAGGFGPDAFSIPEVQPNTRARLSTQVTVPATPGLHRATYSVSGPRGRFQDGFWIEVMVLAPTPTSTPFPSSSSVVRLAAGRSEGVFGGEVTISLVRTSYEGSPPRDKVLAIVSVDGYPPLTIDREDVGYVVVYEAQQRYQIRIVTAATSSAEFQVTRL